MLKFDTKEIKDLVKVIPKEHHDTIRKIAEYYYKLGASEIQSLIQMVTEIPPIDTRYYGVYSHDSIDGG